MEIRFAAKSDVPAVLAIYDKARAFMRLSGNSRQWGPAYPSAETLADDMERGGSFVCLENGRVVATFFFVIGEEPTYRIIEGGEWLNDEKYGVIHRVASDGTAKGVLHAVLDFCFGLISNIRIDTHRDNMVMRAGLQRYGFQYCGIIHLPDGAERLAFQHTVSSPINSSPTP